MKKLFVLIGQEQKERCKAYIDSLPFGRIAVEIGEYKKKRSVEQNARYWMILSRVSEQVTDENGKMYCEVIAKTRIG